VQRFYLAEGDNLLMNAKQDPHSVAFHQAPRLDKSVPEPFFFGLIGGLFGCLHKPQTNRNRDLGVILCYPMGHEHVLSHRAYRQLAHRLSLTGFPTLRFDYFGCGDSLGDFIEANIAQWVIDIESVIREIRQRCGLERICLIGCRLGATLSLLAGVKCGGLEAMVLWDPTVIGADYLQQLKTAHRRMLHSSHVMPRNSETSETANELLGFHISDALHSDLQELTLLNVNKSPANSILLIESNPQESAKQLLISLKKTGAVVDHQVVPCAMVWDWTENPSKVLVPIQILNSIVAWLEKGCQ
jgi:uncharacterized protein